ncbi:alcohol dehydrogenase I-ADH1 [Ilyonectria robusta]
MAQTIPTTVRQWNTTDQAGFDSLKVSEQPLGELGDTQVLVKIQGASLNYRDLIIAMGQYPGGVSPNVVPGSDGAGTVLAVGKNVKRFKVGDKVITLFNQGHIGEKLGADHIINYNETPEWGDKAKELTGGVGVDHVIEVAGPASMRQSLASVKMDGVITIIGFVGGQTKDQPGFLENLTRLCITRGILVGNQSMMEDMCRAIEANPETLRPVVDPKVFTFDQVKEAYEYQWSGKHQGKVCIEVN